MTAERHASPAGGLRAIVDRGECFSFGYCVEALPGVFSLDATGISVAADVDADPGLLAQAADACPRAAISLVRPGEHPEGTPDQPATR